jgi:flagellar basal body rod protein FlgF
MNGEQVRIWKEAIKAHFKVLIQHSKTTKTSVYMDSNNLTKIKTSGFKKNINQLCYSCTILTGGFSNIK